MLNIVSPSTSFLRFVRKNKKKPWVESDVGLTNLTIRLLLKMCKDMYDIFYFLPGAMLICVLCKYLYD